MIADEDMVLLKKLPSLYWPSIGGENKGEQRRLRLAEIEETERNLMDLNRSSADRIEIMRTAFELNRLVALGMVPLLPPVERIGILPQLVDSVHQSHLGDLLEVRQLVWEIPKDVLLPHIEDASRPLLEDPRKDPEEIYQDLLNLYYDIDDDLTAKLALQATQHPKFEVQEMGKSMLSIIDGTHPDIDIIRATRR